MDTIRLVAGDQIPVMTFELKDGATGVPGNPKTWSPLNLTGCVVTGKLLSVPGSTVIATLTAFIDDAPNGKGFFSWGTSLIGLNGKYEMEFVVTDQFGRPMTIYDRAPIIVRAPA